MPRSDQANAIVEYLEIFHNRQRRHSSLGMLSRVEYEKLQPQLLSVAEHGRHSACGRRRRSVPGGDAAGGGELAPRAVPADGPRRPNRSASGNATVATWRLLRQPVAYRVQTRTVGRDW
jgi:hypothetical protein